jgi:putative hydrolase of the HAD superfamily
VKAVSGAHGDNAQVQLQGVLFDLYGTLVDIRVDEDSPRLWHGLASALSTTSARVEPAEVRRRFQTVLQEEGARGREGFLMEPVFRRLLSSFDVEEGVTRIGRLFRELSICEMRLRPYVEPLLERLHHSRTQWGIVSNTEAVLTRFELDQYRILQTAQAIVLSSEVGFQKPDPNIFRLALERINTTPVTTVFIGNDWVADVLGARQVGLKAIYINHQASEHIRVSTGMSGVIEVAPRLEAIVEALHAFGWRETEAS